MALDLSKINIFKGLDARARVLVILIAVVGFIAVVYLATRYLSGSTKTVGPSSVASTPQGLQSVPGGQLTPEYYRALMQANAQAAQQAKITGGSAVPTLVNIGGGQPVGNGNQCNIICSDQNAKVNSLLDDWVKQGKVDPEVATELEQLAEQNIPASAYAARLDQLVKEGKLTPEQARELLEQYKKQHANALLQASAKTMDDLIKSGQLPLDVANQLLTDQKNGMSPSDYAAELQKLVAAGKITPAVAQQLLAQYTQQQAREAAKDNLANIQQMLHDGEISPDVAKDLTALASKNVPLDQYAAELQRLVAAGKLTPAAAAKLLAAYQRQKGGLTPTAADQVAQAAQDALNADVGSLLSSGKISPAVAKELTDLASTNVTPAQYAAALDQLVREGKISPDDAKRLLAEYTKQRALKELAQKLDNLRANNASPMAYADQLKAAVAAGLITPEQAQQLMQEYQSAYTAASAAQNPAIGAAGTAAFAALQQQVQQGNAGAGAGLPLVTANQFAVAQTQTAQEAESDRLARLQALENTMSAQAQQLISSWQPTVQQFKAASPVNKTSSALSSLVKSKNGSSSVTEVAAPTIIKAGSIIFAVLDTAVNSDYPDSPVLATIVEGPYKGAKLLGKLTTTKGVSGQQDRVMLNFSLMNMDVWPKSRTVTAFAVDPDTARVVLASTVDYHYALRYGAVMATSFVQGYANAIQSSSSNTTTGIFGTSTTHPELNPGQKLATAIGQIGQNLGSVTQNYVNIPPTVRVDSGVSLGILFMADVT